MGRTTRALQALALSLLLAGCAQPAAGTSATGPSAQAPTAAPAAAPVAAPTANLGANQADAPSKQAELVCQPEAQEDIEELIGVEPTKVGPLAYADHVATCRYAYPNGAFTLSVQDLPDDITTTRAYEALAAKLGKLDSIDLPDADAFSTTDGSVVLRKDTKVMLVDVAQLPATFGDPPTPRADTARLVMKAVLGCWTEAS